MHTLRYFFALLKHVLVIASKNYSKLNSLSQKFIQLSLLFALLFFIGIEIFKEKKKVNFFSAKSEWMVCNTDDDCVGIRGMCGGLTTINKKNKVEGIEFFRSRSKAFTDCFYSDDEIPADFKVTCKKKICSNETYNEENRKGNFRP